MKKLFTLIFSLIALQGFAQFTSTLPSGYLPFATQMYYKVVGPDTTFIEGATGKGFHRFTPNQALKDSLSLKVDKVSGKQLSTEDYTSADKTKLGGIAAGAEVNVNADWNAVSGDAQILNKPTIVSAEVDPNVPAYAKTLTGFPIIKTSTDALYEPIFSKNTGFNKNLGTASGTVAEGNDSRINNGQTAFSWGNHASAGYLLSSSYTAADVLSKLLTVDGSGSGLDADLLDGQSSAYFTDIVARLGYTPYNATNPAGYISSYTETDPNVPAYAKTLSNFSVIQASTDPLYRPITYVPAWGDITGTVPTWNQNTTGNAATATLATSATNWGGYGASLSTTVTGATTTGFIAFDPTPGIFKSITLAETKTALGLGSAAYTASTAYYATGSTVANSTLWNTFSITNAEATGGSDYFLTCKGGTFSFATIAQAQTALGISGGPFLTVANPTFTGTLTGPSATFTGALNFAPSSFLVGSSTATDPKSLTLQAATSNYYLRFRGADGSDQGGFYQQTLGGPIRVNSSFDVAAALTGTSLSMSSSGTFGGNIIRTNGSNSTQMEVDGLHSIGTDMYLLANTGYAIRIYTSGAERYVISSSGNHDFKSGIATFGNTLYGTSALFNSNQLTLASDGTYGSTYSMISFAGNGVNGDNRIFAGATNNDDIYIAAGTGRKVRFWANGSSSDVAIFGNSDINFYQPLTGTSITATNFIGPATGLTGTASSLTAGAANSVAWTNVSSRPTALSQFTNDLVYAWALASTKPTYSWSEVTSKPTALSSFTNDLGNYGGWTTDATSSLANYYTTTQIQNFFSGASAISGYNYSNWNTAYGWGNHAGLYRPISYVPAWTDVTGRPTALSQFTNDLADDYVVVSVSETGNGSNTAFTISHSAGFTPSAAVFVASSTEASYDYTIATMTSTDIYLSFSSHAPANGFPVTGKLILFK